MTTSEIATVLKVSPSTVRRWLRDGILTVRGRDIIVNLNTLVRKKRRRRA